MFTNCQAGHGFGVKSHRRSYYRVLHVDPEAPLEVIRASYRSMMSILRHHPDRGGDHDMAVLLNEAYAVLSDTERRRRYDQTLKRGADGPRCEPANGFAPRAPALPAPLPERSAKMASSMQRGLRLYSAIARLEGAHATQCAYCGMRLPATIRHDTRCRQCESPVAPAPGGPGDDPSGCRRAAPRVAKSGEVLLQTGWREHVSRARLRDLSVSGVSVATAAQVRPGTVVRIAGASFDVVARVVSCREVEGSCSLHARILAAIFAERAGTFVSLAV